MLAHEGLELAAMSPTRVSLGAVHPPPVPGEPSAGLGVHVLTVAQIEELAFQRGLGLGVGAGPADLALEDDDDWHQCSSGVGSRGLGAGAQPARR